MRLSLAAYLVEELQQEVGKQAALCLAEMQEQRQVIQGLHLQEIRGAEPPRQVAYLAEVSLGRNLRIQMLRQVHPNRQDHVSYTIVLSSLPTKIAS